MSGGNSRLVAPSGPSSPSVHGSTADDVFEWTFDFKFLEGKAFHELDLCMREGPEWFFANSMNLSVTIHAISDFIWETKERRNPKWTGKRGKEKFLKWVRTQKDTIGMFGDLSNTYKHTVRHPPKNRFAETLRLRPRDTDEVSGLSEVERRNYLLQIAGQKTCLYPLITMPNQWLVYFRYAAESALEWWHNHYYGLPQS
jgi:hypothetical protein